MREKDLGDLQREEEFSPDQLAAHAKEVFKLFEGALQNRIAFVEELRFEKGGRNYFVKFSPLNYDQDKVFISAGEGEYVYVQVAKSQKGINLIRYEKRDKEIVSIENSSDAFERVIGVFDQMTKKTRTYEVIGSRLRRLKRAIVFSRR